MVVIFLYCCIIYVIQQYTCLGTEMNLNINPQASNPIYAQIVEQIKNQILSGNLVAGTQLPSVRQLADQLDVNSLTIQKAYKLLELKEMIIIKKGVGAFVHDDIQQLPKKEKRKIISEQLTNIIQQVNELNITREEFDKIVDDLWGCLK